MNVHGFTVGPVAENCFFAARDGWLERNSKTLAADRSYASTLLFVDGMSDEKMLVEIDCIAYVGP